MQLSAAATGKLVAAIGVLHRVGRNGRGTQLRDQIAVLRRLTCRQLQALVLSLKVGKLALRQEVKDCAAVGVGIVDDVAGRVLHSIARVTRLRRHVIAHLRDSRAVLAAAIRGLHLHSVELLHKRRLLVAAGKLGLCKAVCHRHVGAVDKLRLLVKSVAKALIYAVDLALDIGKIRGQHVAVYDAAVAVVPLRSLPDANGRRRGSHRATVQ